MTDLASTSQHPTRRQAGRLYVTCCVFLLCTLALVMRTPDTADAYVYRNTTGTPGAATLYPIFGDNSDFSIPPRLATGGGSIGRSPAYSGTQIVTVQWRVWKYDQLIPKWVNVGTWQGSYAVQAGYRVNLPSITHADQYSTPGGYFSTDYVVTWRTAAGTLIAKRMYDFIDGTDYKCLSGYPDCHVTYYGGQYSIGMIRTY